MLSWRALPPSDGSPRKDPSGSHSQQEGGEVNMTFLEVIALMELIVQILILVDNHYRGR